MKKKILATIILMIFCTLAFCQCVKAETEVKTTIQIKKDGTSWTNISVSDAYDKCQELNNDNSALGTTADNVMAHLSTNADWYAVTLLTYSAYGNKSSANTTGNSSGIINFGSKYTFTSGILETNTEATSTNYQSLIDNKETKFVEKIKSVSDREKNKPGLGLLSSEIITSSTIKYENLTRNPITVRSGLFGFCFATIYPFNGANGKPQVSSGVPNGETTFRPVIWVK